MTIHYPDYPAEWTPLANDAADSSFRGSPMSMFYKGGRVGTKPVAIKVPKAPNYAKGGLAHAAKQVADAGVGGDELIIHINRDEYEQLKKHWGEPTVNPHTGMPQFTPFWKQSWFAPVAAIAGAALAATGVGAGLGAGLMGLAGAGETAAATLGGITGIEALGGSTVGSLVGNTLIGAGVGGLTGGAKGALTGGLLSGLGTIGTSALGKALEGSTVGNWLGTGSGDAAKVYPIGALDSNPASVGAYGPQVPPGAEGAYAAANTQGYVAPGAGGSGTGIMGALSKPGFLIPAAILGASALGGGSAKLPTAQGGTKQPTDPNLTRPLETTPLSRTRLASPMDYYSYGAMPEQRYYAQQPVQAAMGGPLARYVQGGGTGRSDSIDAKLSDGEYVIDAETVSLLGDGSSKAGAQRLDQMRANIRKQKGRALSRGKFSPDAKRPEEYI
jgi:hypothetical protein